MDLTITMVTKIIEISVVTPETDSLDQIISECLNVDDHQYNLRELISLVRQAPEEERILVGERFQWLIDSVDNDFSDILIAPAPFSLVFDNNAFVTGTFSGLKTDLLNYLVKYDLSNLNNHGNYQIARVCWSEEDLVSYSWANQKLPINLGQLSFDIVKADIGSSSDDLWIKSITYNGKHPDKEKTPASFWTYALDDFYFRLGNNYFEPFITNKPGSK